MSSLTGGTLSRLGPICCAVLLVGCSGDDAVAPGALASITLSPSNATVTVGQTRTLTATGKDASGSAIDGLSFTWATSDDGVATVADGEVTGVAAGSASITASSGGVTSNTVTVTATLSGGATDRVVIDQASVLLPGSGESAQLTAQILDPQGSPLPGTITWRSSAPDRVSVDATGKVTAAAIGSAQIFAESGGLRSAPTLAFVASPAAGALLLTDDQVVSVGQPLNLPPGEAPGVGTEYEVTLTGVTAPSTGTVILGAETAPVAGTVVSTRQESGQTVVTVAIAPLYQLFTDYDIALSIDLSVFPAVAVPTGSSRLSPSATWNAERRRPPSGAARARDDDLSPFQKFKCDAGAEAHLASTSVTLGLENELTLVLDDRPGYSKHALEGSLALSGNAAIKLDAGFEASVDCRAQGQIKLPVTGWFSVIAMPAVRAGLGAGIKGELKVAEGELGVTGKVGVSGVAGWECGEVSAACRSLDAMTPLNELKTKSEIPTVNGMHALISGQFYALAGLDVSLLAGLANAEIVEARLGPEQTFDLAFEKDQAARADYASSYDLKVKGVIEPGSALKKAIKMVINDEGVGVTFKAETTQPVSESPKGTLSLSKALVGAGQAVDFTVALDQSTTEYKLIGHNVKDVELYRKAEGELEFSFWKAAEQIGSNSYGYHWVPAEADVGKYQFAALVNTQLVTPLLEVAPNSIQPLEVSCFSGGSIRLASSATPPVCIDTWFGTSTVIIKTPGMPEANITSRADITWTLDLPNSSAGVTAYKAAGNFTLSFDTPPEACTITLEPSTFVIVQDTLALMRLSIIDNGITPPIYTLNGSQRVDFTSTAHCPNREDVVTDFVDFNVPLVIGNGPFTRGQLVLSGHTDDGAIESTWNFVRP
jgi:hypothetical protein